MTNSQNNSLVSIVLPIYNAEKTLDGCINSILSQTLKRIEVICVNDGSTDRSLDIIERYSKADSRVRVISQKNAGAGAARNRGIIEASGEYLGFVDSDDCVDPNMFETLYNRAKRDNSDLVICGVRYSNAGIHYFTDSATMYTMESKPFQIDKFPVILKSCFLWNRLFRRQYWEDSEIFIPEGRRFAEDMLPCTKSSVCAKQISYISEPLYTYITHDNSLTDKLFNAKSDKLDYVRAVKETKEFLSSRKNYPVLQKQFLQFSMDIAFAILNNLRSGRNFRRFLSGLSDIIDNQDIAIMEEIGFKSVHPEIFDSLARRVNVKVGKRNV